MLLPNGTLLFPPFNNTGYRPDVHAASYQCAASNQAGRVLSVEVHVRAVVVNHYEALVEDVHVMLGNTAVFRCRVPSTVQDFLTTTSWVKDSAFNIYPTTEGDWKHVMLSTGELHVVAAGPTDTLSRYTCRTLHRLTGHTQESRTAGRLLLTEPNDPVAPRLLEKSDNVVSVRRGEDAVLPCVAQGFPAPTYWWYRQGVHGVLDGVEVRGRRAMVGGSLVVRAAQPEDEGVYVCRANNTEGAAIAAHTRLVLRSELTALLVPLLLRPDLGQPATFNCLTYATKVVWLKDGQQILSEGADNSKLVIPSVQRDDQGMYQCIASTDNDSVQSTAELRLGASRPQLLYKFIAQTLQPGPDVSLKCIAAGQPTPQIRWVLDGFPLPRSDRFVIGQYVTMAGDVISHVNITKVVVEDGGSYECIAENRVGSISHAAPLHIYGMPVIRKMPPLSAVAGEHLILTCPAAGFPIQAITWEKDGRVLPMNHRQRVHPNGTLHVANVQQKSDQGTYTCQAQNRQGHSDRGDVAITVMVPPEITPFAFSELAEGARLQVACTVHQGDLPLNLTWLKNWAPLPSHVQATRFNNYSSILTMNHAMRGDNGNYTCLAANPSRTTTHTALLTISVPPEWVVEPRDTSAIASHSVALHCQADGFPQPQVMWRRAHGKQASQFDALNNSLQNGTLILASVTENDEGYYLCEANNGIGAGLSAVIFLTVNALPRFVGTLKQEIVSQGSTANFLCEAVGDMPMHISWRHNGIRISPDTNHRYHIKESLVELSAISHLSIHHVTAADSGKYVCIASNPFGKDETVVQLTVQDVPEAPADVRVIECGSRDVKLSWREPSDGNSPILYYSIMYSQEPDLIPDPEESGDSRPWTKLSNLEPSTTYYIQVVAVNKLGAGSPSAVVRVTTEPEIPSGPPTEVAVVSISHSELQVTWDPPHHNHRNGPILGYYVGIMQLGVSTESRYNYTTVKANQVLPFVIGGLRSFTSYQVTVQAFNSVGAGPSSEGITTTTLQSAPAAPPRDMRCAPLTPHSLQVHWADPPTHTHNGIIIGYKITFQLCGNSHLEENPVSIETSNLSILLTDLKSYHNYTIYAAAFTSQGVGPVSQPLTCITAEDAPSAPGRVCAALSSPRSAIISWTPPINPNGLLIHYNVYQQQINQGTTRDVAHQTVPVTKTLLEIGSLLEGSVYEWWVTASTRVGEGPSSPVHTLTPSSKVPAVIVSFPMSIVVPWKRKVTLDCQSVGSPPPEVGWTFNWLPLEVGAHVHLLHNNSVHIDSVLQESAGNYTCTASNKHGRDHLIHTLAVLVPPLPPSLMLLSVSSSNVTLKINLAIKDRANIKGFILRYRPAQGDWEEEHLSGETTKYTITGLLCGTTYEILVAAFNKVGIGKTGPSLETTTAGDRAIPPGAVSAISSSLHSITVHLEQWQDNYCPISHFYIEKQVDNQPWITVTDHASPGTSYTVFGLEPATFYYIRVTAINNRGTTISEFAVATLGGIRPDHAVSGSSLLGDLQFTLPVTASAVALLLVLATVTICLHKKTESCGVPPAVTSPAPNNASRSDYCSTLFKKPAITQVQDDLVHALPDYDDIHPYAPFQEQKPRNIVTGNWGFQTFVFEGGMEGCEEYSDVLQPLESDVEEYDSLGSESPENQSAYLNNDLHHNLPQLHPSYQAPMKGPVPYSTNSNVRGVNL